MKGVVFNLFEAYIVENRGEDVWDDIVDQCQFQTKDGIFVGVGTYPDEDMMEVIEKAVTFLELELSHALRSFGSFLFAKLNAAYPVFAQKQSSLKGFLKSVESVIHIEVNKLYPDAATPKFKYEEPSKDTLLITYSSKRHLCFLMEGLLEGAAELYKTPMQQEQTHCFHRGDGNDCVFKLNFS